MDGEYSIRQAGPEEAALVGRMMMRLMQELFPEDAEYNAPGVEATFVASAERLLRDEPRYFVFVARDPQGAPVGTIALNECAAIYAWGLFGEITELYVEPTHRSAGLGRLLIDYAKRFAVQRRWTMLEVGAPDTPRWQRSVDFYQSCDFIVVGPRLYLMTD